MLLLEKLQKRTFDLVSNAYTSIRADDLAKLMGITADAAVSGEYESKKSMSDQDVQL